MTRASRGGPDPVPSLLGKPKALAAGDAHTCALDADGVIWCWGRGDEGQLGDGTGVEHPIADAVDARQRRHDGGRDRRRRGAHLRARRREVLCWGRNAEGQLARRCRRRCRPDAGERDLAGASRSRPAARHTCAIDGDATVSCWGANESGQLGNGTTDSSNVPCRSTGLTNVDAIVAGGAHSCARRTDGTVWCWGANTSGQLGDGVTLSSPRPLLARIACP